MAAGDITFANACAGSYVVSGGARSIYGSLEHDETARAFQVAPSTGAQILACKLYDKEGTNVSQLVMNSNDGTADTSPGSIWLLANPSGDITLQFEVTYAGG